MLLPNSSKLHLIGPITFSGPLGTAKIILIKNPKLTLDEWFERVSAHEYFSHLADLNLGWDSFYQEWVLVEKVAVKAKSPRVEVVVSERNTERY